MKPARFVRRAIPASLVLVSLLGASACAKPADAPPPVTLAPATTMAVAVVRVTALDLGKAIGPDKNVTDKTNSFRPADTIFVTVATDGASGGTPIKARWMFQDGQVVEETTQTIAPAGPAVTEFHIAKPSGFPKGDYKVEIFVDGVSQGTRDFKVG